MAALGSFQFEFVCQKPTHWTTSHLKLCIHIIISQKFQIISAKALWCFLPDVTGLESICVAVSVFHNFKSM